MVHNTGIKSGSSQASTGALSVSGPQPGWMTLDEARERAFTGEIVFEVDPEVFAYLDNGVVYYAERASDASLARRLLDAGVVDRTQLERGTVRVGDVEHLGRLFEREASIDRDAVLVVTETSTEELIAELANHAVTTVRVTAYRHHPSGVHRWFVAQFDAQGVARQIGTTGEIDRIVGLELSSLDLVADVHDDELIIEWDELSDATTPLDVSNAFDVFMFDPVRDGGVTGADLDDAGFDEAVLDESALDEAGFDTSEFDTSEFDASRFDDAAFDEVTIEFGAVETIVVEVEVEAEFVAEAEADVDVAVEAEVEASPDAALVEIVSFEGDPIDFQVTWPHDSEDVVLVDVVEESPQAAPAFTQADNGDLRFEMPALELSDDDFEADEVPDEVAAAVRRAIAAIEMVSGEVPVIPPLDVNTDLFGIGTTTETTTEMAAVESASSSFPGFAPPTPDMSAEVIYAQQASGCPDAGVPGFR